jgi:hypothetical protein
MFYLVATETVVHWALVPMDVLGLMFLGLMGSWKLSASGADNPRIKASAVAIGSESQPLCLDTQISGCYISFRKMNG